MSEDSINKITVYRLNIENFDNITFQYYKIVKSDVFKVNDNSYPYKLFFFAPTSKTAGWFPMFTGLGLTIMSNEIPSTQVSGFVLVVRVQNSYYAVTGGVGHIHLKKAVAIEHRFGIILAEKILSLPELRGLSQKDTSGIVNYIDRIFRGTYNPTGDFNNLKRVLTHVRGKLKKTNKYYSSIGKSLQASDALSVNGRKQFPDIMRFLIKVEELWNSGDRNIAIPQLECIDKKFHRDILIELETALVNSLCNYSEENDNQLFIDNQEIGFLPDRVDSYDVLYNRQKISCDSYQAVFVAVSQILNNLQNDAEKKDTFNKIRLEVHFDNGINEERELSYFIFGDITYNNEVYFLNNKLWYKASDEFVKQLDNEINNIRFLAPEPLGLSSWDSARHTEERLYNNDHTSFIILDRRLIQVNGERGGIEFCDLCKVNTDGVIVIHVKHDCGAALRGLFAQGDVSSQLYAQSEDFRNAIIGAQFTNSEGLDASARNLLQQLASKQKNEIKIVYAIYDDKPSHTVSQTATTTSEKLKGTLTTFAKVDLLSRINNIRSMGYDTAITRIKPYPQK